MSETRVIIYTRVSKDLSGEGDSNKRQEEACRMLATMRGWEVVEVIEDISISAYKDVERPGWSRVLKAMRDGRCDVVVAWKLDRVTRTVAGLVELIRVANESGVTFATTDGMLDLTSATGKAVATILGAVAQMEAELKAERQALANQQRRTKGEPWRAGWRAFGYDFEGNVVPAEAELVRRAYAEVLEGKPIRQIAREWNEAGLFSHLAQQRGSSGWTHQGVREVLLNPRNAAWMTYADPKTKVREIVGDGAWEPLVDRDLWSSVVAFLNTRTKPGAKPKSMLAGVLTCAKCGGGMDAGVREIARTENGVRSVVGYNSVYVCKQGHAKVPREEAENLIVGAFGMTALSMLPGLLLTITSQGVDPAVQKEVLELHASLADLAASHAAGRLPLIAFEAATSSISSRLEELESMESTPVSYDARQLNRKAVMDFVSQHDDVKREILQRVATISVKPQGRGASALSLREQIEMDVTVTRADGRQDRVRVLP